MSRSAEPRRPMDAAAAPEVSVVYSLPETGYLRLHQIIGRPARNGRPAIPALIPVSRSTWWVGVKTGRYPQPVRTLGPNITVWRVEDVLALIEPSSPRGVRRLNLEKNDKS